MPTGAPRDPRADEDADMRDAQWLVPALSALDEVNARDPHQVEIDGASVARELAHARRASWWLDRLVPNASPALRLAVRAHHVERWLRPRDAFERSRAGYLRWRKAAQEYHAERMRELVAPFDPPADVVDRAALLIRKTRPDGELERRDWQAFEDVLCLVFIERQLADFAVTVSPEKLRGILEKTLPKMSSEAIALAAALPLAPGHRELLRDLAAGGTAPTADRSRPHRGA